jgi:hypothetical protein
MRRRILVTATAMMLAAQLGTPLSAAQPSAEQLGAIAGYLEDNDVQGLRDYLELYPDLTEGETALAVLLRRFLVESIAAETFFRFESDLSDAVNDLEDDPATGPDTPGEPPEPGY